MDLFSTSLGDLRGLATILCMLAFLSVVWWAYSPSRKKRFESASMIPFADPDIFGSESVDREKDSAAEGKAHE